MNIRVKIVLSALLIGTVSQAAAQPLTLERCRQLALDNNRSLKAASEQERAAYYQKREALLNFFPKATAGAAYIHFNRDLHLIGQGAIPSGIPLPAALGGGVLPLPAELTAGIYDAATVDLSNNWVAGVNLMQPIFAGGKIVAYNDLRKCAHQLTGAMLETRTAEVITEVDEAYWQVVSLTSKCELATSYVALLQKLCDDTDALLEEGMATKADKLSVGVKLNEAELALTKATNGLSLSKMLLCQICGIEITDAVAVADRGEETFTPQPQSYDMDEAIGSRSEIRSLALVTKIADRQARIAFSEYLPVMGLTTGYNWIRPSLTDGLQNKMGGMWNVGVGLSVPLNFGTNSAKHNAAKAQVRKAQYELEEAEEKVRLQITQSDYKLTEAAKKMEASHRNAERADENLRYANAGFEEGVIPASDVLGAHTAWMAAHAEQIDAQIDLRLCRLYLDKALGKNLQDLTASSGLSF